MPDGSHVIKVDGQLFRAITPAKVEELANQKDELQVCKVNETRFIDKVALADANVKIAEQERDIQKANFIHAMSLYDKERELRVETMQFIPHGKVSGFGGKFLNFLDGPAGQSLFKLVIPTAQFIKVMKQ